MNTLSWPARAVVCRKDGSYILYNFSGGFSWYLFGPDNRLQHDIAGVLGTGAWGYIVGTYDKDADPDNQRLYLNGARVAQMSDTQPIDLNSAALGIGRHVSGIADPFNGHIDEFRISHVQRSDGWIETTWNNMSDSGAFAAAGAEEEHGGGGEPPPLAGAGVVVCLMRQASGTAEIVDEAASTRVQPRTGSGRSTAGAHRPDRVLRLLLAPRHGAAVARRSVRLPAPMGRGACAHCERATRHAPRPALAWSPS